MRALRVAGATMTLALAASASADQKEPLHGFATVAFARLPVGHVPFPEAKPPAHVPVAETLAGFYFAGMPVEQDRMMKLTNPHMGMAYMAPTEAAARALGSGSYNPDPVDTCLSDGAEVERRATGDDTPLTWPTRNTQQLVFQFETPPNAQSEPDVHAIHSERFVAGTEGHATLEVVDAWADVRTRGVRLLDRYTLSLTKVFTAPNELEVYAARDGEVLQVVLHYAMSKSVPRFVRDRLRSVAVNMPDQDVATADCGHLRFQLRAPAGTGQMATLQSTAFLPPSEEELATLSGVTGPEREMKVFAMMRKRAFQLAISESASAADTHPVVSISIGWLGHERSADL